MKNKYLITYQANYYRVAEGEGQTGRLVGWLVYITFATNFMRFCCLLLTDWGWRMKAIRWRGKGRSGNGVYEGVGGRKRASVGREFWEKRKCEERKKGRSLKEGSW